MAIISTKQGWAVYQVQTVGSLYTTWLIKTSAEFFPDGNFPKGIDSAPSFLYQWKHIISPHGAVWLIVFNIYTKKFVRNYSNEKVVIASFAPGLFI